MSQGRHGEHSSKRPRHRQQAYHDDAHISNGRKETNSQVVNLISEPGNQLPVGQPGPWSHWIPADTGKWFYQGRMKADGSGWEYQFTDGRPVPAAADPSNAYGPVSMTLNIFPQVSVTEQPAGQAVNTGNEGPAMNRAGPPPRSVPQHANCNPASYCQSQSIVTIQTVGERRSGGSRMQGSSRRGSEVIGGRKKKLSSIVKAEKELTFNPKKSVKNWLNGLDP